MHLFPDHQALLDYATHRLLWSWYRRDRDAQSQSPPRDSDADDKRRTEPGTGSDLETDENGKTP